jgi:hypothetical protein
MTRTTYIVRPFQNAQKSDSLAKPTLDLRGKSGFLTAFSKAFPKTEMNVVRDFPITRTAMLVKRVKEGVWKRR